MVAFFEAMHDMAEAGKMIPLSRQQQNKSIKTLKDAKRGAKDNGMNFQKRQTSNFTLMDQKQILHEQQNAVDISSEKYFQDPENVLRHSPEWCFDVMKFIR